MFWNKKKLRVGRLYACLTGIYAGAFLIYIRTRKDEHGFLRSPEMVNLWVPKKEVDFAIEGGILEFVTDVPAFAQKVAAAKFEENELRL
jgi:hypothetical protein